MYEGLLVSETLEKMVDKLQLAEVVQALREELDTAKLQAEGHNIRFNVDNIEVEFQTAVELEASATGGGKLKFWVLDIDAKASGKYKNATTHKIKLNLSPIDTASEADQTGDNKVRISGRAQRL